jgi:phosphate transport system protein
MPHRFHNDLEQLKRRLLSMGALAEGMLQKASAAVVGRDTDLVKEVREDEKEMNALQREIDNEVIRLIGVYTPVAADLRFLLMATRINGELERIGDQAENVCDHFEKLIVGASPKPFARLPRMATIAQEMLHEAIDAFLEQSEEKAVAVMKRDDEVDDLNDEIRKTHLEDMARDPSVVSTALGLIFIARSFERVADLAVDISEDVVYLVRGEDVRHVKTSW